MGARAQPLLCKHNAGFLKGFICFETSLHSLGKAQGGVCGRCSPPAPICKNNVRTVVFERTHALVEASLHASSKQGDGLVCDNARMMGLEMIRMPVEVTFCPPPPPPPICKHNARMMGLAEVQMLWSKFACLNQGGSCSPPPPPPPQKQCWRDGGEGTLARLKKAPGGEGRRPLHLQKECSRDRRNNYQAKRSQRTQENNKHRPSQARAKARPSQAKPKSKPHIRQWP